MSYRTFKRVLGETSLERKCRFLFGTSLLLLILSSFLWCGRETERIIYDKPRSNSRHLVGSVLLKLHAEKLEADPNQRLLIEEMTSDLEDLVYEGVFIALEDVHRPHVLYPGDNLAEREILLDLKRRYDEHLETVLSKTPSKPGEGVPMGSKSTKRTKARCRFPKTGNSMPKANTITTSRCIGKRAASVAIN